MYHHYFARLLLMTTKTAFILSLAALVIAYSTSALGKSPTQAGSLSIHLPRELLDTGWSVRSVKVPAKADPEATTHEIPGQGAAQRILLENRSLKRAVPLKDGSQKQVHAQITLAIYSQSRMSDLLPAWDAAYEAELKAFRELMESSPQTAIGAPRDPDTYLFWQTRDHVLLLFEDEVGFAESARVKAAIKRQLVGQ